MLERRSRLGDARQVADVQPAEPEARTLQAAELRPGSRGARQAPDLAAASRGWDSGVSPLREAPPGGDGALLCWEQGRIGPGSEAGRDTDLTLSFPCWDPPRARPTPSRAERLQVPAALGAARHSEAKMLGRDRPRLHLPDGQLGEGLAVTELGQL